MQSIASGRRSPITTWEFFLQDTLPEASLCTAVMGIPLIDDKIILSRNHRGREFPGGHIDPGETIHQALARELEEEAGITDYTIDRLYGVTHVVNQGVKTNPSTGLPYPPIGYIPFFIIQANNRSRFPHGEEIEEANSILLTQSIDYLTSQYYQAILKSFLKLYSKT